MFAVLGIVLALYTIAAAAIGRVWAKSGPGGRIVSREASPDSFWMVIVTYAVLSAALLFCF